MKFKLKFLHKPQVQRSDKFFTSKIRVNLRFFRTYRKISGK